ncbi:MAG: hypothetical protein JXB05_02790 [Myxococcaceae bacterium]|nr:hypothetical protein [Myxococcaceae bacterium]
MNEQERGLAADLAQAFVAQGAPQELPLFGAMREVYLRDPERALAQQSSKGQPLGFGMAEAAVLLTPVALKVATEVVRFISGELGKHLKEEGSGVLRSLVRRIFQWFKPSREEPAKEKALPPRLTPELLVEVHAIALAQARQVHIPEQQAQLLADSMVGSLSMASATTAQLPAL